MYSYVGTWESTQYPKGFVHGDAYAQISKDFTTGTFMLVYRGTYRHGDQSVIQLTSSTSASQVVPIFKGSFQTQQITFTPKLLTPEELHGLYSTSNPSDKGLFSLKEGIITEPFVDRSSVQACNIL